MQELILKITFDDTDGYKGHGEDTKKIIKFLLERELQMELVQDKVIKNFKVEILNKT